MTQDGPLLVPAGQRVDSQRHVSRRTTACRNRTCTTSARTGRPAGSVPFAAGVHGGMAVRYASPIQSGRADGRHRFTTRGRRPATAPDRSHGNRRRLTSATSTQRCAGSIRRWLAFTLADRHSTLSTDESWTTSRTSPPQADDSIPPECEELLFRRLDAGHALVVRAARMPVASSASAGDDAAAASVVVAGSAASPTANELRIGEDWPWFLGPRHDGTSAESDLLEPWPETGLPLVWEKGIGTGYMVLVGPRRAAGRPSSPRPGGIR